MVMQLIWLFLSYLVGCLTAWPCALGQGCPTTWTRPTVKVDTTGQEKKKRLCQTKTASNQCMDTH